MTTDPVVLNREMFTEAEASRLLQVAQSTLHYWLEGGERRGRLYKPVIRVEPRGDHPPVTWAEFIEAGLLRTYRRNHKVPMVELRTFIERLRDKFGVPYPLAHEQPFVADRQLIRQAQDDSGLDPDFCLVAEVRGQLVWTYASDAFMHRVVWHDGIAAGWRPHEDSGSPVVMRPELRFGRPSVGGIRTEVIWEHSQSDEDPDEIASEFELSVQDVNWALAYENSARSGRAA